MIRARLKELKNRKKEKGSFDYVLKKKHRGLCDSGGIFGNRPFLAGVYLIHDDSVRIHDACLTVVHFFRQSDKRMKGKLFFMLRCMFRLGR